jgi:hypothetical protein
MFMLGTMLVVNALEDAGFSFIVGSRISKAPYDLAEHFERHGDYFADGQTLESSRVMGTGKAARSRRVVYPVRVQTRPAGQPGDQRDDRAGQEDRCRDPADQEGPVRQARRRQQVGRPGSGRPDPPTRRAERLRHQHRPQGGWAARR